MSAFDTPRQVTFPSPRRCGCPSTSDVRQLHALIEGDEEGPLTLLGIAKLIQCLHLLVTSDQFASTTLEQLAAATLATESKSTPTGTFSWAASTTPPLLAAVQAAILDELHSREEPLTTVTEASVRRVQDPKWAAASSICVTALHFQFLCVLSPLCEAEVICRLWQQRLSCVARMQAATTVDARMLPLPAEEQTALLFTVCGISHSTSRPASEKQHNKDHESPTDDDFPSSGNLPHAASELEHVLSKSLLGLDLGILLRIIPIVLRELNVPTLGSVCLEGLQQLDRLRALAVMVGTSDLQLLHGASNDATGKGSEPQLAHRQSDEPVVAFSTALDTTGIEGDPGYGFHSHLPDRRRQVLLALEYVHDRAEEMRVWIDSDDGPSIDTVTMQLCHGSLEQDGANKDSVSPPLAAQLLRRHGDLRSPWRRIHPGSSFLSASSFLFASDSLLEGQNLSLRRRHGRSLDDYGPVQVDPLTRSTSADPSTPGTLIAVDWVVANRIARWAAWQTQLSALLEYSAGVADEDYPITTAELRLVEQVFRFISAHRDLFKQGLSLDRSESSSDVPEWFTSETLADFFHVLRAPCLTRSHEDSEHASMGNTRGSRKGAVGCCSSSPQSRRFACRAFIDMLCRTTAPAAAHTAVSLSRYPTTAAQDTPGIFRPHMAMGEVALRASTLRPSIFTNTFGASGSGGAGKAMNAAPVPLVTAVHESGYRAPGDSIHMPRKTSLSGLMRIHRHHFKNLLFERASFPAHVISSTDPVGEHHEPLCRTPWYVRQACDETDLVAASRAHFQGLGLHVQELLVLCIAWEMIEACCHSPPTAPSRHASDSESWSSSQAPDIHGDEALVPSLAEHSLQFYATATTTARHNLSTRLRYDPTALVGARGAAPGTYSLAATGAPVPTPTPSTRTGKMSLQNRKTDHAPSSVEPASGDIEQRYPVFSVVLDVSPVIHRAFDPTLLSIVSFPLQSLFVQLRRHAEWATSQIHSSVMASFRKKYECGLLSVAHGGSATATAVRNLNVMSASPPRDNTSAEEAAREFLRDSRTDGQLNRVRRRVYHAILRAYRCVVAHAQSVYSLVNRERLMSHRRLSSPHRPLAPNALHHEQIASTALLPLRCVAPADREPIALDRAIPVCGSTPAVRGRFGGFAAPFSVRVALWRLQLYCKFVGGFSANRTRQLAQAFQSLRASHRDALTSLMISTEGAGPPPRASGVCRIRAVKLRSEGRVDATTCCRDPDAAGALRGTERDALLRHIHHLRMEIKDGLRRKVALEVPFEHLIASRIQSVRMFGPDKDSPTADEQNVYNVPILTSSAMSPSHLRTEWAGYVTQVEEVAREAHALAEMEKRRDHFDREMQNLRGTRDALLETRMSLYSTVTAERAAFARSLRANAAALQAKLDAYEKELEVLLLAEKSRCAAEREALVDGVRHVESEKNESSPVCEEQFATDFKRVEQLLAILQKEMREDGLSSIGRWYSVTPSGMVAHLEPPVAPRRYIPVAMICIRQRAAHLDGVLAQDAVEHRTSASIHITSEDVVAADSAAVVEPWVSTVTGAAEADWPLRRVTEYSITPASDICGAEYAFQRWRMNAQQMPAVRITASSPVKPSYTPLSSSEWRGPIIETMLSAIRDRLLGISSVSGVDGCVSDVSTCPGATALNDLSFLNKKKVILQLRLNHL